MQSIWQKQLANISRLSPGCNKWRSQFPVGFMINIGQAWSRLVGNISPLLISIVFNNSHMTSNSWISTFYSRQSGMWLWLGPVGWGSNVFRVQALLLRQHPRMKLKAVITWIFLGSPVMPDPNPGQQQPDSLYSPTGGIYMFALCCISSRQPCGNFVIAMLEEGCGP